LNQEERKTLVDLAETMETSILQAAGVAGNEYLTWGDLLKAEAKKNRTACNRICDEHADAGSFTD
jgi:hypothetical protein